MDYYSKNLYILRNLRTDMYNIYSKTRPYEVENDMIVINDVAKDNNKYMTIHIDNKSIRLNSSYRPVCEAQKWAMNCFEDNVLCKIIIVYGFGNGYFIRELLNKMGEEDKIIVYEPFISIFESTLKEYDISDILSNSKLYLFVGKDTFFYFKSVYIECVNLVNVEYSKEITLPQYEEISKELYNEYCYRVIGYKTNIVMSRTTLSNKGNIFAKNSLYSISHMKGCTVFSDFKDMFNNCNTAIIVAAGPSLDKNVNLISKAKNKAMIVGTDAAMNTLLSHNIIPDIMVSVDPLKKMNNFKDDRCFDIPLLCTCHTVVDLLKKHRSKKTYVNATAIADNILEKIGKKTTMESEGGSVATQALNVCVEMKFNNIIFVGQDLAYGQDMITHTGGLCEEIKDKASLRLVDGVFGEDVISRPDWIGFLKYIEECIANNPNITFIDATEGGALIHGSKVMSLQDAIDNYCVDYFDYENTIKNVPSSFSDDDLEIIYEQLDNATQQLDSILDDLNRTIVYCNKIISAYELCKYSEAQYIRKNYLKIYEHICSIPIMNDVYIYCMPENARLISLLHEGKEDERSTWINYWTLQKQILENYKKNIPELIEWIKENNNDRM